MRILANLTNWSRGLRQRLALLVLCLGLALASQAAEYRPLPPAPAPGLAADGWLLHDALHNRLILYLPGYHAPAHAYYQWVRLRAGQPWLLSFEAQPGLSLFIDNRLVSRPPRQALTL